MTDPSSSPATPNATVASALSNYTFPEISKPLPKFVNDHAPDGLREWQYAILKTNRTYGALFDDKIVQGFGGHVTRFIDPKHWGFAITELEKDEDYRNYIKLLRYLEANPSGQRKEKEVQRDLGTLHSCKWLLDDLTKLLEANHVHRGLNLKVFRGPGALANHIGTAQSLTPMVSRTAYPAGHPADPTSPPATPTTISQPQPQPTRSTTATDFEKDLANDLVAHLLFPFTLIPANDSLIHWVSQPLMLSVGPEPGLSARINGFLSASPRGTEDISTATAIIDILPAQLTGADGSTLLARQRCMQLAAFLSLTSPSVIEAHRQTGKPIVRLLVCMVREHIILSLASCDVTYIDYLHGKIKYRDSPGMTVWETGTFKLNDSKHILLLAPILVAYTQQTLSVSPPVELTDEDVWADLEDIPESEPIDQIGRTLSETAAWFGGRSRTTPAFELAYYDEIQADNAQRVAIWHRERGEDEVFKLGREELGEDQYPGTVQVDRAVRDRILSEAWENVTRAGQKTHGRE